MAVRTLPTAADTGMVDLELLSRQLDRDVAAVLLASPDCSGVVQTNLPAVAEATHTTGALFVVRCDPISLGVLAPPAAFGADITCGDIQSLGMHQNYGGGQAGFLAVHDREKIVRELPARIFGVASTAVAGEYGFGDVAFDRTSFARRENGKEWVGTAAALWGITAAVYLALMGPNGMAEIGETILSRTRYAMTRLAAVPGIVVRHERSPHFREFVAALTGTRPAGDIVRELRHRGVLVTVPVSAAPSDEQALQICVTERHTKADIDRLANLLEELL